MRQLIEQLGGNFLEQESRIYCSFQSLTNELASTDNAVYLLSHLSGLYISGKDCHSFLQGQISIDVHSTQEPHLGCYCNKEGRIITIFYLMPYQEGFLLVMPAELLALSKEKFKRYALFSKVSFEVPDLVYLGFDNLASLEAVESNIAQDRVNELKQSLILKGSLAWQHQQLIKHIPSIYPASSEIFLPHKIGLDKLNALDFKKGCYLGQEIIARMHYKAKMKNSMAHFISTLEKKPGDKLYINEKPIGEVVDTCKVDDSKHLYLASVLTKYAENMDETLDTIS